MEANKTSGKSLGSRTVASASEIHRASSNPRAPAGESDDEAFAELLPDEREPFGAKSQTDGDIPPPVRRPGEHHACEVGASDQQDQTRYAEQNGGETGNRAADVIPQQAGSAQAQLHAPIFCRVFVRQLLCDGGQIRFGLTD